MYKFKAKTTKLQSSGFLVWIKRSYIYLPPLVFKAYYVGTIVKLRAFGKHEVVFLHAKETEQRFAHSCEYSIMSYHQIRHTQVTHVRNNKHPNH